MQSLKTMQERLQDRADEESRNAVSAIGWTMETLGAFFDLVGETIPQWHQDLAIAVHEICRERGTPEDSIEKLSNIWWVWKHLNDREYAQVRANLIKENFAETPLIQVPSFPLEHGDTGEWWWYPNSLEYRPN